MTIKPNTKFTRAKYIGNYVALFGSCQLLLLDSDTSTSILLLEFDCNITIVNGNSEFLVVGDSLGTVHIIDIHKDLVLYSQQITLDPNEIIDILLGWKWESGSEIDEIFIVLKDGMIIRLYNVEFGDLSNVGREIIKSNMNVQSSIVLNYSPRLLVVGGTISSPESPWELRVFKTTNNQTLVVDEYSELGLSAATCMVSNISGSKLVVLGDNRLIVIDVLSYCSLTSGLVLFDDILHGLVQIARGSTGFLGLFKVQDSYCVKNYNFETLKPDQEYETENSIFLIDDFNCMEMNRDLLVTNSAEGIELIQFATTDTNSKLLKLVKDNDIQKALIIAKESGIDIQTFHRMVISSSSSNNIDMESLKKSLRQIDDLDFILEFAYKGEFKNDEDILFLINTIDSHVYSDAFTDNKIDVRLFKLRFASYSQLKHLCGVREMHIPSWGTFLASNMLINVQYYIGQNSIGIALMLWRRHAVAENLVQYIPELLDQIPSSLDIDVLILIADAFRSSIFESQNTVLDNLLILDRWVMRTCEMVEHTKGAAEALGLISSCLQNLEQYIPKGWSPKLKLQEIRMSKLVNKYSMSLSYQTMQKMKLQLQDIMELRELYNYEISLASYGSTTHSGIIFEMLDNVQVPEMIAKHVQTVTGPFAKKHGLKLDEALVDYSKDVMNNPRQSGHPAESKILSIIQLVTSSTLKIELLLEVMRRSSIPWSADLQQEIDCAPSYLPKNMEEDFGLQIKLMNVKLMLQRYDINHFNVADTKLALKLVPFILARVDKESAFEDAKMCVDAYQNVPLSSMYVLRAQAFLSAGMVNEFRILLETSKKELEFQEFQLILKELRIWIHLKSSRFKSRSQDSQFSYFLDGELVVSKLNDSSDANAVGKCIELYNDYHILIAPSELEDDEAKSAILDKLLKKDNKKGSTQLSALTRIGDLLNLNQQHILEIYAEKLMESLDYPGVFSVCQELCENHGENPAVKRILVRLLRAAETNIVWSNIEFIAAISRVLLVHSTSSDIEEHLSLFKQCDILQYLMKTSDLGTYKSKIDNNDRHEDSTLDALLRKTYDEKFLIGSGKELAKLLYAFLRAIWHNTDREDLKGKQKIISTEESGLKLAGKCFDNQNYNCCINVIHFMQEGMALTCEACPANVLDLQSEAFKMMLENVLLCDDIDFKFALGCMLSLPRDQASTSFKNAIANAGKNFSRLNLIARVGVCLGSLWNQRAFQVNCMDLAKHFRWLQEFQLLRNSF